MKSLEKNCCVNLHCRAEYFIIRRSQSLSLSKFNAEVRQAQGKGASRRLRHNGQIPAIIYGGSEAPVSIILNHDELNNAQVHDSFYSDVITLVVEGKEVAVKVQAMQRHPFKPKLVHIDFKRA